MVSTTRKQRAMHSGAQLDFSCLVRPETQPMAWCRPLSGRVFPLQVSLPEITLIDTRRFDTQKCAFLGILNPIKLMDSED